MASQPATLVYGVPNGCSFGSLVALEWSNLPYQLIRHDFYAKNKHETFVKISPSGQTPVFIKENGAPLLESLAILSNIGSRDLSKGLHAKQGTEEWDNINFLLSLLHTAFHGAWGGAFKSKYGLNPGHDEAFLAESGKSVLKVLTRLEEILVGRTYLAGDHKSVADAYFIALIRWNNIFKFSDLAKEFPNVYRLEQLLEKDPAVIFAHAIEEQKEAKTSGNFVGHTTYEKVNIQ
jgi:glutathione S-transferase